MALKVGMFLRHPLFGLCRVTAVDGATAWVSFSGGSTSTVFNAERTCREVPASEVDAANPLLLLNQARSRTARGTGSGSGRARPCAHCGRALNTSLYARGRALKSCPNCSAENEARNEHVFLAYPSAFGTTDHRASEPTPDGAQSHCEVCRFKTGPQKGKLCSEVGKPHLPRGGGR